MSAAGETVSVVIPTLRRPRLLAATLASFLACDPPPDEILVVDGDVDASARDVVADAQARASGSIDVRYIGTTEGLSRQRNLGVDESRGDLIVFADDDVVVEPEAFGHLRQAFADPTVVGVTGRVVEPQSRRFGGLQSPVRNVILGLGREGRVTRFGYPRYPRHVDRPMDLEFMWGCFMSGRRGALERVRFDETMLGYALAEDQDFSYRLSRTGRIRYVPEIVIYHRKLGFASQDRRSFDRLVVENRAYLFRKNFRRTPLARIEFGLFVGVLVLHRAINGELGGVRGLIEGSWNVLRR